MARWIPTKRQKYGVGECLPRPTLTRAPLSPLWPRGTGAHSATRSCCCSPGRLARSGVKVLLGSGTLILPHPNPNSSGAHCGNAPGPHCRRWPARAARGMVRFASVQPHIPFGSPKVPLLPSLGLQPRTQAQTKWEAELASRGEEEAESVWRGKEGKGVLRPCVSEDTHLTYW